MAGSYGSLAIQTKIVSWKCRKFGAAKSRLEGMPMPFLKKAHFKVGQTFQIESAPCLSRAPSDFLHCKWLFENFLHDVFCSVFNLRFSSIRLTLKNSMQWLKIWPRAILMMTDRKFKGRQITSIKGKANFFEQDERGRNLNNSHFWLLDMKS